MKKTVFFLLLAVIMTTAAVLPASAEADYKNLLLLGDSITYGYGLEGDRDSCPSYGNQLKNYLGITGSSFTNAAVNGDTSADLLALLPSLTDKVSDADLIVISIGGNDLLRLLWNAVTAVSGQGWTYNDVAAGLSDPAYVAKIAKYVTLEAITSAITGYAVNLALIVSFIRQNNPYAEVIFLAQYDPMSGAAALEDIGVITSGAISLLNAAMKSTTRTGDCIYLDIFTPFEGNGPEWTNITAGDIHPNKTGHGMIYKYIVNYLETGLQPDGTPAVTTAEVTSAQLTTAPVTRAEPVTTAKPLPETTKAVTTAPGNGKTKKKGCGSAAAGWTLIAAFSFVAILVRKKRKT